jgi:hypothetical protein
MGTNSVHTRAGSGGVTQTNANPRVDGAPLQDAPTPKPVEVKEQTGEITTHDGIGAEDSKFDAAGNSVTHSYRSTSRAPANTGDRVVSDANARFFGTGVGMNRFGDIGVAAGVHWIGQNPEGSGLAVAEGRDPEVFELDEPGSFDFNISLGSSVISYDEDTGLPEPSLALFSDSELGFVHFDLSVSFLGVEVNDEPLDGELFRLVIEGRGPIHGLGPPEDLEEALQNLQVAFLPSDVLGLDPGEIDAVETFVRNALGVLADGSIGLEPGVEVVLFGDGGARPTLTIDYDAGVVVYEDSAVSLAAAPEPAPLALLVGGLLLVGLRQIGGNSARISARTAASTPAVSAPTTARRATSGGAPAPR